MGKKRRMERPLEADTFGWIPNSLYISQIWEWVMSSVGDSLILGYFEDLSLLIYVISFLFSFFHAK
jgi:hypothetical protein